MPRQLKFFREIVKCKNLMEQFWKFNKIREIDKCKNLTEQIWFQNCLCINVNA
jgi:hypothetical protein